MIFRKTKPKTISEIHSKGVKSSRLSNFMRLKARQCTFVVSIISLTACFKRGVHILFVITSICIGSL